MKPEILIEAAAQAAKKAYAPHSKFQVGAALLCADGTVFTGCNVENASYGLTNCAERTAVFSAVAAGHREFNAMAVVADGDSVPFPCGACRQVLNEFCGGAFPVYVASADALESYQTLSLGELLPHGFRL
ncbi:MAG TPA: cytidine deaminase [Tichowtungia sp.]|nr:cytidine deaminase [Tichowtungia sp.]